jgi:hypothetical protein
MSEKEMQGGQSIQDQYKEIGDRKKNAKKLSTKVKGHLKRHKTKYIVGGVGLTVGAGLGTYLSNRMNVTSIDLFNRIENVQNYKPVIQISIPTRRGHAGNLVKCVETGETFASQNRAAELLGLSASQLSQHIRGNRDDVKGFHFEKVDSFNK